MKKTDRKEKWRKELPKNLDLPLSELIGEKVPKKRKQKGRRKR